MNEEMLLTFLPLHMPEAFQKPQNKDPIPFQPSCHKSTNLKDTLGQHYSNVQTEA